MLSKTITPANGRNVLPRFFSCVLPWLSVATCIVSASIAAAAEDSGLTLMSTAGRPVDLAGVSEASPKGLSVLTVPNSQPLLVNWSDIDLSLLETSHPHIHRAYKLALDGETTQLDLGVAPQRWWKGNMHTHSFWSDGNHYPDMVADWYHSSGYNFLVVTDHNVLQRGDRWVAGEGGRGGAHALEKYRARFGSDWIEERIVDGEHQVRLKPLNEYRHLFEERGKFLLINGEEITDRQGVHMNAINLKDFIPPQGGPNPVAIMQNNVNMVRDQRQASGQSMILMLAHPNFVWAHTAEEIAEVEGLRFFEVYNGHPSVNNAGNAERASTDRIWDIVLAKRLGEMGEPAVFGMATDDGHNYHREQLGGATQGRGWVFVRSRRLTPEHLIQAIEAGDFYGSTGVTLRHLVRGNDRIELEIEADEGVEYVTQFIGTRIGYDPSSKPVRNEMGEIIRTTHRYSEDIGEILKEVAGARASYSFDGDELYVRAHIVSNKDQTDGVHNRVIGKQSAWIQPVVVTGKTTSVE